MIFFGHSFGGIIAFELSRKIKACGRLNVFPSKLIVSAIKNPISLSEDNKNESIITHHTQRNEDLLEYIIHLGGLPVGIDKQFLIHALPTVRADYQIFETYHHNTCGQGGLDCPITALCARSDVAITEEMMTPWGKQTSGAFSLVGLRGTHFYLTEQETKLDFEQVMRNEVESVLSSVRGGASVDKVVHKEVSLAANTW
eukprot:gene27513-34240_t